MELFENSSLQELVNHAIQAMTKAQDKKLTSKNLDIGIVGKGVDFKRLSEQEIEKYLNPGMVIDS